jgi:hypothetical protein
LRVAPRPATSRVDRRRRRDPWSVRAALVDLRRASIADRRRGQARPVHPAQQPERAARPAAAPRDGATEIAVVRDDEQGVAAGEPRPGSAPRGTATSSTSVIRIVSAVCRPL